MTHSELTEQGWEVRVTHFRYPEGTTFDEQGRPDFPAVTLHELNLAGVAPNPKGGVTVAWIRPPHSERAFTGLAYCHPNDNYIKRLGVDKAVGRAYARTQADPCVLPKTYTEITRNLILAKRRGSIFTGTTAGEVTLA